MRAQNRDRVNKKRALKAEVRHHNEVWIAEVGKMMRMTGEYKHKPREGKVLVPARESSSATVLAIDPETKTIYTDGRGGAWAQVAQVHHLEVIEWADEDAE